MTEVPGRHPQGFEKEAPGSKGSEPAFPNHESSHDAAHLAAHEVTLNDIFAWAEESPQVDKSVPKEIEFYERDWKRLLNEDFEQNIKFRKRTARCLFWMVAIWLILIMAVVFLQGFSGTWYWTFRLANTVLVTLISSSTATVLGLFVIVARYFFSIPKK